MKKSLVIGGERLGIGTNPPEGLKRIVKEEIFEGVFGGNVFKFLLWALTLKIRNKFRRLEKQ